MQESASRRPVDALRRGPSGYAQAQAASSLLSQAGASVAASGALRDFQAAVSPRADPGSVGSEAKRRRTVQAIETPQVRALLTDPAGCELQLLQQGADCRQALGYMLLPHKRCSSYAAAAAAGANMMLALYCILPALQAHQQTSCSGAPDECYLQCGAAGSHCSAAWAGLGGMGAAAHKYSEGRGSPQARAAEQGACHAHLQNGCQSCHQTNLQAALPRLRVGQAGTLQSKAFEPAARLRAVCSIS